MQKQKITPFLWFDNQAEEAMNFYTSVFKDSKAGSVTRYPEGTPGQAGTVMTASFELFGQQFIALNGGPIFNFTEAVSFSIDCKDQEEIDYYWEKLTSGGGQESQCGWLKDKFGLSWQVVPSKLSELMSAKDPERSKRVVQALMPMKKIDIETLQRAYDQVGSNQ